MQYQVCIGSLSVYSQTLRSLGITEKCTRQWGGHLSCSPFSLSAALYVTVHAVLCQITYCSRCSLIASEKTHRPRTRGSCSVWLGPMVSTCSAPLDTKLSRRQVLCWWSYRPSLSPQNPRKDLVFLCDNFQSVVWDWLPLGTRAWRVEEAS